LLSDVWHGLDHPGCPPGGQFGEPGCSRAGSGEGRDVAVDAGLDHLLAFEQVPYPNADGLLVPAASAGHDANGFLRGCHQCQDPVVHVLNARGLPPRPQLASCGDTSPAALFCGDGRQGRSSA